MRATRATVQAEKVDVAFALCVGPKVVAVIKRNDCGALLHNSHPFSLEYYHFSRVPALWLSEVGRSDKILPGRGLSAVLTWV
jgi:hypothetical protein